jgi:sec-independent protein translocase protein TatA
MAMGIKQLEMDDPGTLSLGYSIRKVHMIEGLLQPMHLLIILVVAVFVFGPKKLPELGKGLAEGIRSFKDGVKGDPPKDTTPVVKDNDTTPKA